MMKGGGKKERKGEREVGRRGGGEAGSRSLSCHVSQFVTSGSLSRFLVRLLWFLVRLPGPLLS